MENRLEKNNRIRFIILMIAISFVLFFRTYDGLVISYNSSLMALSYKYGFISRGLFGSIYLLLDSILPFDLMTYSNLKLFFLLFTICFFAFFIYFANKCLKKGPKIQQLIILFYLVFLVTFFSCSHNFGRVDICMCSIAMLSALLIIEEKCVWLCIPLSAIAVMFHQGYVFMYFNVTLALLLYRTMTYAKNAKNDDKDNKKFRKYLIILVLSFVVGSIFFLYFELFSHSNGQAHYDEVVEKALLLGHEDEGYHEGLIQHEILGIDPADSEIEFRLKNRVEFPVFLLFFSQYILILVFLFKRLISNSKEKIDRYKYMLLAAGSLTILPNMLLKCDYARWVFAIMTYYVLIIIALLVMGDEGAERELTVIGKDLKSKPYIAILFVLPILFTPFWDVNICRVSAHMGGDLNKWFFHLWQDPW